MVTIQIYGTNDYLESQDEKITYIKTSGDLSDLSKVNSSYSWSLKFPKTPNNTQVLRGLGLIGSTSSMPYNKVYCNLLDNGLPIVTKGLLNIKDTSSDYYGIFIQEGFIDFLRDLNNDSLSDLDLSELDHQRDYTTIINSLDLSLPYSYLIADVNGAFNPDENNTTNLRSAFMSPFANVGYIWDLIFDTYGWTYQINPNTLQSINDTWMSYPSEVVLGNQLNQNIINAYTYSGYNERFVANSKPPIIQNIKFSNRNVNLTGFLETVNDYTFKVLSTGNYLFNFKLNLSIVFYSSFGGTNPTPEYKYQLQVNGVSVFEFKNNIEYNNTFYFNENDIFKIIIIHDNPYGSLGAYEYTYNEVYNNIFYVFDTGQVSFTKALMKFKVNTFIKEIMTREALTSFVDADNKIINFLTLTERFEQDITNWSDRYIDRKKESYTYSNYGQINTLKHKYKDELSNFNDGNILVDNSNLPEEKNLYTSIGFSPNNELTNFSDNGNTYKVVQIPTFEVDVKEDKDTGDLIGDYKFLKDRFFFVKAETTDKSIYIDYQIANNIPIVSTRDVLFNNIVFNKYKDFYRIGDNAKVHEIELGLSLSDILFLDLKHLYYFEQQASFYLLNKLKYETGKTTVGEFLKVDLTKKIEVQGSDNYDNSVDACASGYFQQLYIESGNQFIDINDKVFIQDINGRFVLINNNDYYIKDFDNNKVYRVINGVITTIINC